MTVLNDMLTCKSFARKHHMTLQKTDKESRCEYLLVLSIL